MPVKKKSPNVGHKEHFLVKISDKALKRIKGINGVIDAEHTDIGFVVKKVRYRRWEKVQDDIWEILREERIF